MKAVISVLFLVLFATTAFAQVPDTLWTYELLSHCYGSPACADIDFDGYLEIVFGTYFDDEHAYCLNAEDGSLKWRYYTGGGPLDAAPVIADVDLDGSLEVIIPASWGIMFCFNGDGSVQWIYPRYDYVECIDSPPSVTDVDGDNRPEVIFGAWYGKVYVLNGEDGSLLWERCYCEDGYVQSAPCILDCNMDGDLDIVIGMFRGDCKLYALHGADGETLWTYQADDWMYAGAATADIDLDGLPELVVGDYSGKVFALEAEDGSFKWERSIGYYVFPPVTIAELNDEYSGPEILAAENELYCLSADGSIIWDYPTGGLIDRGAVVAEVDGDEDLEVIFGSSDCYLYVLNGEDGSLVWRYYTGSGYPIENAPVVADFDLDGWVDIFFIGGHGTSDTVPNYGRAYAVRAGPGNGETWTMYRHDAYRSGYLEGGPAESIEQQSIIPDRFDILCYPNPFNSVVTIAIGGALNLTPLHTTTPHTTSLQVDIFDINGRLVWNLDSPWLLSPDSYSLSFSWQPDPSIPTGIYLIKVEIGKQNTTRKVIYLK
ncbi:PQQ-binding-like beta-propeller repeat protein [bacterium]|nr:PQQ-binding-like beta-propeller repeat protein [bacterium]